MAPPLRTRTARDDIASDLEVYLRRGFHIPDSDVRFSRDANLWEGAYVDSTGIVELIVHLESRWGVDLPDEVVFDPEFSSVNGIARLVHSLRGRAGAGARANGTAKPSVSPAHDASLVLMQSRGEGAPLFLVHAGDGLALPYANLARRLAGTRPVYALQLLTEGGLPMVHTRIEEMAAQIAMCPVTTLTACKLLIKRAWELMGFRVHQQWSADMTTTVASHTDFQQHLAKMMKETGGRTK